MELTLPRLQYVSQAGDLIPVWKPTPLGYVAAANVVEAITRPPRYAEIRPEFMEHLLLLNELSSACRRHR